MSEVWKRIFKDWVETYDAIAKIQCSLIEDEEADKIRAQLLDCIIETLKQEVEE